MKSNTKTLSLLLAILVIIITLGYIILNYIGNPSKTSEEFTLNTGIPAQNTIKQIHPIKGNLQPSIYDSNSIVYVYNTDGDNVYFEDKTIAGADPVTFFPIENGTYIHNYAKDNNYVYYKGDRIEGADPLTFEILWTVPHEGCRDSHYSKDKNRVFFENKVVPGADPQTFIPLVMGMVGSVLNTESYGHYGKDKNSVFKETEKLIDVKSEDFTTVCDYG